MLKFIAKRLANYVVMLFVAISCTYFLASGFMRPRSNYESRTPRPPAASINRSLDLANINDHTNIFTRYWRWLTGVVTRWDWGLSPDLGSVNGALAPRIVASTELVTIATVLSIVLGVALGIYTAQRQYKWQDRLFGTTATFFLVIPTGVVTRWDWGLSPDLGSVNGALAPRIVASTELVTIATVLSIVLGVALGIYTAQRQYKWQDRLFGTTATFFLVIPTAVFALLVVMLAIFINGASGFRLFYVTGLSSYTGNNWFLRLADFGQHIILPTIVLTILGMVSYHLTQRTYLLDEMHADYVRTARAKGLTRRQAIRRHALRASLIPTAVNVAFSIASVFTGAVITESIFAINGLGRYFIQAILDNDINASVAIAAFGGVCTLAGALLADIVSAWLDPRIKMS